MKKDSPDFFERKELREGQYKELHDDPRTQAALKVIDGLAKKMRVSYAIIGGFAAYLYAKNPPEDFPDVDIILYESVDKAKAFIKALGKSPKFHLQFLDIPEEQDSCFGTLTYANFVQFDMFTSLDEKSRSPRRVGGYSVEPVEPLIVEKLIRGTREDVLMAIDLLAFVDHDKALLGQIAREYRATGMLQRASWAARRWALGRLAKEGLKSVVNQIVKG